MYLARHIDGELMAWKNAKSRKPILLRGARQVGKSSTVRHFATNFEYYVEVNFDENPKLQNLFETGLEPIELCEQLSAITNTPIIEGKTLLFFDEIQACIPAISALRYFYEKLPDLHLIAAGSLLEFALEQLPSFGVGRIRSIFLYPFSFEEFLMASKENGLLKLLHKAAPDKPMSEISHQKLKQYLKKFMIIGGMPEVVSQYILNGDILEVQRVLNDLVLSLEDDFAKYREKVTPSRIREVFSTVVQQIGNKFTYSYPHATINNVQIKEALNILILAGLIYPVTHSAATGIPLGAEVNLKKVKYLILDTGIFQRILGLNIGDILLEDDINVVNKGNIAELFVGLELLKNASFYHKNELYFWQRDSRNSQAEVDYLIQKHDKIFPIEVKAGNKGKMQSLYLFLEEKKTDFGFRVSLENFSEMEKVKIYPLYGIKNLLQS